jgi:hypothetical protein
MEKESNKDTWYLLLKGRHVCKTKIKGKRVDIYMINQIYCYPLARLG